MMQFTYSLAELAKNIGAELHGEAECIIKSVAGLKEAKSGQITFLENPRYKQYLPATQASAVILSAADLAACPTNALVVKNPHLAYAKLTALFEHAPRSTPGIHPTAVIETGCQIHPTASIGPHCVIGVNTVIAEQVVIGAGCVIGQESSVGAASHLWPRVTLYHGVKIGKRVIIHSGAVLGSDGFGFAQDKGTWHKIAQLGGVIVGDDVEIGANTTIDRGAIDDTILEEGVKLDNLIQIGHNVVIGAHTAIAGCVGIAGSTKIGKHCALGGGAGIAGHITIADNVMITAGSGVAKSITEPGIYSSGIPAQAAMAWKRNLTRIYQLDDNARRLRELEKLIAKK